MISTRFAPTGKFRLIEIDEIQKQLTTVESDFTNIIGDYDELVVALREMLRGKVPTINRFVFDERGVCLGSSFPYAV